MSMKDVKRSATRITVEDISKVAAQSVPRALEAREARGVDLTEDEIKHVGGGPGSGGCPNCAHLSFSLDMTQIHQMLPGLTVL